MNKRMLRVIILISLVAALVLGGCLPGKPAAEAPAPAPEPAAPAPEASPEEVEPIKVGAPFALTGYFVEDAVAYSRGVELAVDDINAAGGLLGRPLEIVYFDTADFAPETLVLAADTLVGVDKVDVVITAWSAGSVGPFGKYDVPYIHGETTDAAIAIGQEPGNGNVFASIDGQPAVSKTFYDALMDIPYEYPNNKIAVIGADDDYSRGVAEAYRDYAAADGWDVVMMEIVPYGTAEWGPILAKVRANEPALLHIEIPSPPEVISFFRQFMLDPTPTILSYGWSLPPAGFMSAMGEEANGLLGNTGGYVGWPPPTQEVADWVARFEAKFDGARPRGGPDNTYDITMMWAEAVRQVGDPSDYDAIVQWLQNNTFQAMPGFRVIDFDERNTAPEQNHPLAQVQVQDGEWFTLSHNVYGDPYVDYQGKSYEFQIPSWIE